MRQFLSGVAGDAADTTQMTEGLRAHLSKGAGAYSDPKSEIKEAMKDLKSFSFIACKDVEKRGVERIGFGVKNLCSYKMVTGRETHYATFYLTAQDKIADIWLYSHDE